MVSGRQKIPEALPIHQHARGVFHELSVADVSDCHRLVSQQLFETCQQAIDDPGDDVNTQMKELIFCYQELASLEASSRTLEARLDSAKQKYHDYTQDLDPVDSSTWDHYTSSDTVHPPSLSRTFLDEQAVLQKSSRLSREDKLLGALVHLWEDPTAIMPDDQNNDEDIHIEGGKIELRCPITCKSFKDPRVSKRCNHVFDLEGLENYFQGHTTRDCPQGGCSQKLSMNDFEVDEVMKLRCQIENVKKRDLVKAEITLDII